MREVKGGLDNINGIDLDKDKEGQIRGGISATWRKKEPEPSTSKNNDPVAEGDKENQSSANDEEDKEKREAKAQDVEMDDAAETPASEEKTDQ